MGIEDLVYVAASPLHGRGLFARTGIARGSRIATFEGPPAKRNGKYVLWITDARGRVYGRRGRNALRFLNHADRPNAEFRGFVLFATRRIRTDEEITIDYHW